MLWSMLAGQLFLTGVALATNEITSCYKCCATNCATSGCAHGLANCITAQDGKCELDGGDDSTVECTTTNTYGAVILYNGTDLDMHGDSLACTASSCPGVWMVAGGSRVLNELSTPSTISGPFTIGVDCAEWSGSVVEGIAVDGASIGISKCRTVRNNVIQTSGASGSIGVRMRGQSHSDSVTSNFIETSETGLQIELDKSVDVTDNVIYTAAVPTAINIASGTPAEVSANIILGSGPNGSAVIIGGSPGSATIANNLCNPDHPDCLGAGNCIDASYCVSFTPPFTTP